MPWRALPGVPADAYRIWLSEIMLQQTTVVTVGPYFLKFVKLWPTLSDLALASLDDILRMWAGLGYYRRARMLHSCAQVLHKQYEGKFPMTVDELIALPGFGPYTAAAVAAIAFDQPANVVDGNVERVVSRIFAIDEPMPRAKKIIREAAASLVPSTRCGDYAQALMDLGAIVCTPKSPKCLLCPWSDFCRARDLGIQESLPVRQKSIAKPVRRAVAYVAFNGEGAVFLKQRPDKGLLAGMMEVPSSPWEPKPQVSAADIKEHMPVEAKWNTIAIPVTHVFTHFIFEVTVVVAQLTQGQNRRLEKEFNGCWIKPEDFETVALPTLMKKIISSARKNR